MTKIERIGELYDKNNNFIRNVVYIHELNENDDQIRDINQRRPVKERFCDGSKYEYREMYDLKSENEFTTTEFDSDYLRHVAKKMMEDQENEISNTIFNFFTGKKK